MSERQVIILQGVSGVNTLPTKPLFHPQNASCLNGVCSLFGLPIQNVYDRNTRMIFTRRYGWTDHGGLVNYVLIDNKRRILTAVKKIWITRVTTVFPRQGHYASDPRVLERFPQADMSIERIGDLLHCDLQTLLSAGMA